jgi:hypothetical protein
MTSSIPFSQHAGIVTRSIAWFVLVVLFLCGLPVVLVWPGSFFLGLLVAALLLALPVLGLWWLVCRKNPHFKTLRQYLKISIATLMLMVVLISLPVYYLSFEVNAHPSAIPQVTLTNGSKTVVFQGMVHVGSEPFYKSVVYDLEKALSDGYTLFYEGVQPSPGEGDDWFRDNLAGGGDLSDNYKMLSSVCGMQFQLDYFSLLAKDMKVHPDRHVTADVTTLDMKREFDRLAKADPKFAAAVQKKPAKPGDTKSDDAGPVDFMIDFAKDGTPAQKNILGILCRGAINASMSSLGDTSGPLAPVILDYRNRHLAQQIITHHSKKIYITYGAAHLPGVLALLKEKDPKWRVVSTKWMRAVGAPEHLTGVLPPVPQSPAK